MTLTSQQVRAARSLLSLTAEQLAVLAKVGVATVRRFEGGAEIGDLYIDAIQRALEAGGVVFIEDGAIVEGHAVGVGVALSRKRAKAKKS